jgi:hypothetical protein
VIRFLGRNRPVTIEVAPEVFASADTRSKSNEHVIITGASDQQAAGDALDRAGLRFGMVTNDGRELSDEEAEALEEGLDTTAKPGLYTPNWVSPVGFASRGPWCYVDCKGYITPAMRQRLVAILVEELDHAGVSARVEVPRMGELYRARRWSARQPRQQHPSR